MSTFRTHDVQVSKPDSNAVSAETYWGDKFSYYNWKTKSRVEKSRLWGCSKAAFLPGKNSAFVSAIGKAYNYHIPLALGPDAIWSVITHGFSTWINQNAEQVRNKFVQHKGKAKIEIDVEPIPDWNRVMGEFSDHIADHIGPQRLLFINDFTTTTPDSRIGSEALLMYGMSQYFDYKMMTLCGFPSITIEGTPDDWRKIFDRVKELRQYSLKAGDHLSTWLEHLLPVVEEFVHASEGKPNIDFWRSLYNEDGGSGGPYVTGHVVAFYPYLEGYKTAIVPNTFKQNRHGLTISSFPNNSSQVLVEWNLNGEKKDMHFEGGVLGVEYEHVTNTIRPHVGWCVSETLVKDE